jgi:lysophospholipase L1-like esterase
MKRAAIGVAAAAFVVVLCLVLVLVGEGLYSVLRWNRADQSVTYKGYSLVREAVESDSTDAAATPDFARLAGRDEFEAILPALKAARAGLGDTDYDDLGTDEVNMRDGDGCLAQRPDQRKVMAYIRSTTFQIFDPPLLFVNEDAYGGDIEAFVETYGGAPVRLTINASGERVTVPTSYAPAKVLVAGDSVANGVGVDDPDTLSSQLQALDPARQYVNLGIASAGAADIACALERAASRYDGAIDELIYVYCENDFDSRRRYGTPEALIGWLRSFVEREGIDKTTIVFAPYIYNVIPQLTRFKGYRGEWFPTHFADAKRLEELAREAGFRFVSVADIAVAEIDAQSSQFAAFSLFVDHVHLSPLGTERLVEQLRKPR